jgi:hypothetical protein
MTRPRLNPLRTATRLETVASACFAILAAPSLLLTPVLLIAAFALVMPPAGAVAAATLALATITATWFFLGFAHDRAIATIAAHEYALCIRCRYPLAGVRGPVCPECAEPFEIGDVQSYWRSTYPAPGAPRDTRCFRCGYHLTGLPASPADIVLCPECGACAPKGTT